jgi:CRISPR-associated protein Cst2
MAFISGLLLIDCPASALNNAGTHMELEAPDRGNDNWTAIKKIKTGQGVFPYVSAQAFRYWLRDTLNSVPGWKASPVFREDKVAYTDADPIKYAEDDLFGYMRAPGGKGKDIADKRAKWTEAGLSDQDTEGSGDKQKFAALTRSSPFKMSTLISIGPLRSRDVGSDFGTMSRFEGDPVPFTHEFYRTTLVGTFSIDLRMLGRFYHVDRTGYRHLDAIRKRSAEELGLKTLEGGKAFELPLEDRKNRLAQLLNGLACHTGGAKQALHYTDVSPRLMLLGVAKGGNHLFPNAVGADRQGQPQINVAALQEVFSVFGNDLLSGFYGGLARGYLDEQRDALEQALKGISGSPTLNHPVEAIRSLIADLDKQAEVWLA